MVFRTLFPGELLAQLDRLQRDMLHGADDSPSIRGVAQRRYPAINLGSTPESIEVFAFLPGIDPAALDVHIETGVLTIDGERAGEAVPDGAIAHVEERFAGRFRRVVSLPDDVDSEQVQAKYRDGLLHIRVARKSAAKASRIAIQ